MPEVQTVPVEEYDRVKDHLEQALRQIRDDHVYMRLVGGGTTPCACKWCHRVK